MFFIKLKAQSINNVGIPSKESNKFISYAIRLAAIYIFVVTYDEILETIFSRE